MSISFSQLYQQHLLDEASEEERERAKEVEEALFQLREMRNAGFTTSFMAKCLGIHQPYISNYFSGRQKPSSIVCAKLAEMYVQFEHGAITPPPRVRSNAIKIKPDVEVLRVNSEESVEFARQTILEFFNKREQAGYSGVQLAVSYLRGAFGIPQSDIATIIQIHPQRMSKCMRGEDSPTYTSLLALYMLLDKCIPDEAKTSKNGEEVRQLALAQLEHEILNRK